MTSFTDDPLAYLFRIRDVMDATSDGLDPMSEHGVNIIALRSVRSDGGRKCEEEDVSAISGKSISGFVDVVHAAAVGRRSGRGRVTSMLLF